MVQCDYAFDENGQEVKIQDAVAKGKYICQYCRQPMTAKLGKWNEHHFAHQASDGQRPCTYSSETYRHAKAKQLLKLLLRVQVPAVYAAVPVGYTGKVPRLAKARQVVAAAAVLEQNIYVDEHGEIGSEKRELGQEFDNQQGRRHLLCRPDVVFFDADNKPILFIEVFAEHRCTDEKIARLRTVGVDTIEIHIPRNFDAAAIEALLSVTSNTYWLYNGQQAAYHFTPSDSLVPAAGSVAAAELEDRLSGRAETIKCRFNRVDAALFAVGAVLARADVEQQNAAYSAAEATGQTFTAGLEAQRTERDSRLGAAVRKQVERRRARLAGLRGENQAREIEIRGRQRSLTTATLLLGERIRNGKAQIARVLAYLKSRAERITEGTYWKHDSLDYQVREAERKLSQLREREYSRQRTELAREERELSQLAERLDAEEAAIAAEEMGLGRTEETTRRAVRQRVADLAAAEQRKIEFDGYQAELQAIKSGISSGRPPQTG